MLIADLVTQNKSVDEIGKVLADKRSEWSNLVEMVDTGDWKLQQNKREVLKAAARGMSTIAGNVLLKSRAHPSISPDLFSEVGEVGATVGIGMYEAIMRGRKMTGAQRRYASEWNKGNSYTKDPASDIASYLGILYQPRPNAGGADAVDP